MTTSGKGYGCAVKVKQSSPCASFNKHHAIKAYWGTSALDGGEWSASHPGHFIPRQRVPGIHWIGDWVGPRAGLGTGGKKKIPSPCRDSKELRRARSPALYRLNYHNFTLLYFTLLAVLSLSLRL
jgi:hypothetical protein